MAEKGGMKHKELISIRTDYRPVFILGDDESEHHWKTYIPHDNFLEFLNKVIKVVEGKDKKTSVWLQGSYGVGKSHACSVVAHLLFDPWEYIKDYVEKDISDPQTAGKLKNLRKEKRFIPVYLIGTGEVPELDFMSIYIKNRIATRLQELNLNVPIPQTEIDLLVEEVEKEDESELLRYFQDYYTTKEALLMDLKRNPPNSEALRKVYRYFAEKGKHILKDFKEWLKEVNELIYQNGFSGILLIWDEFTQILDIDIKYLEKVQNLLAENPNIYLIIVSHRTAQQYRTRFDEQTLKKVADRFVHHHLKLVETTVFQILKRAVDKNEKWKEVKDQRYSRLPYLVDRIVQLFEDSRQRPKPEDIRDLYPLHPYTVLLATHIADRFLSAGRSIFDFLFGEEGKLVEFMEKEVEEEPFLTVDYLWDYFYKQIEERDLGQHARDVFNHFNTKKSQVENLGEEYLKVFKALMVFNILYKSAENPSNYLYPNEDNIKLAYTGTPIEGKISEILNLLDTQGIIRKNPDGNFLVASSLLPENELKDKENQLKERYKSVSKVIKDFAENEVKDNLFKNILREIDLLIVSPEEAYKNRIFEDHKLKIILGIPTTISERDKYREKFFQDSKKLENVIFILWEREFTQEKLEEWNQWKAKEEVAQAHNIASERDYAEKMAKKILKDHINKDTHITIFFRGQEIKTIRGNLSTEIDKLSAEIFHNGPDTFNIRNENLWKKSGKIIEKVLKAERLEDLVNKSFNRNPEKELLKALEDGHGTKILKEDFSLNDRADPSHPIIVLKTEIEKVFSEKSRVRPSGFEFLKKPPYGLYNNKVSAFMISIAFKVLQDKLFKVGIGKASIPDLEEFIRGILEGKRTNVELRLGSEIEEKLADSLKDIFSDIVNFAEDDKYILQVRNRIREFIKEKVGYPIWAIAHLEDNDLRRFSEDIDELKSVIRKLSKFIRSSDEEKEEVLRGLYDDITKFKFSLKQLITKENFIKGWNSFIERKIGRRNVSKEEVEEELELSKNPNFWEEEKLSALIDNLIYQLEKADTEPLHANVREDAENRFASQEKEESKFNTVQVISGAIQMEGDIRIEEVIKSLSSNDLVELVLDLISEFPDTKNFVENWLRTKGYG